MRSRELRRKAKRLGILLPTGPLPKRPVTADMIRAAIKRMRRLPESLVKEIEEELGG